MRNLTAAQLARLKRDGHFWMCFIGVLFISAVAVLVGCRESAMMAARGYQPDRLDDYFFNVLGMLGLAFAIFDTLFLGAEYAEGTLRNQLIVGHGRRQVYLAHFAVCCVANAALVLAWFIGGLAGAPFLGWLRMPPGDLALALGETLLGAVAFAGLFVLAGTLITGRATGVVAGFLLFLGLLLAASYMSNALWEPETVSGVVITMEGVQMMDPQPNPHYVAQPLRTVYQFLVNALPTGQGIQLANADVSHPALRMTADAVIALLTTGCGVAAFKRKNLK